MKSTRRNGRSDRFRKYIRNFGLLAVFVIAGIFISGALAENIENGEEVELDTELTYYLTVKYDGVDVFGVESSDTQMANITSNRIKVTDKLPQGLTFQGFVTTSDGTIGATSRGDGVTRCGGRVYDDTHEESLTEGKWNADNTEYTYHGLHYNKSTDTVSFYAEGVKAGCELTVGIVTKTPATVDDPDTEVVETRRDFYNTAAALEGDLSQGSNTVHSFIGRDTAPMYKVTYEYTDEVPMNAASVPTETEYTANATVNVAGEPKVSGYTFSGWHTEDATVTDGVFTMPEGDVHFTGFFIEKTAATKYSVSYRIDGDTPDGFMPPKTKEYEADQEVVLDSLTKDTVIDGYKFSGWTSTDAELSSTGFTMPEKNVVISGSFTRVEHTITYAFQGEVMPPNANSLLPATETHYLDEEVTLAANPTVDGYRFTGWYHETTFNMPDKDLVIAGEWMREAGTFAPEISMKIVDAKDKFKNGETVKFEITVTNPGEFDLADVYLQELLEGAEFSEAGPSYKTETPTLVRIPTLAAGGSVKVYANYTLNISKDATITNTVKLLGAVPADDAYTDFNLDPERDFTVSTSFVAALDFPINPKTLDTIGEVLLVVVVCSGIVFAVFRLNTNRHTKSAMASIYNHGKKALLIFISSAALISGGILLVNVFADDQAVPSIELNSSHASFDNEDPGAWKVTKSAKWTSKTTAEVKFTVDSIAKPSGNDKDIILVLDNSTSMEDSLRGNTSYTTKLQAIQRNATELITNALDNQDSQIALISFATDANIVVPFTNNADELVSGLNSMVAYGSTNYYKALTKVEEVLQNYEVRDGRDIVVLFVTDGLPVKQTPQEIAKYMTLKANYDGLVINSVQYDMGETIVPQLTTISDNQFIVQDAAQLDKALFEAASVPYYYQSFNISDYVNADYWTLASASANFGTATTNTNEQSIAWDLGKYFRPGQETKPELSIKLNLNAEFHEADDRWPTNAREAVSSTILDGADENIDSTDTPILQHKYNVSYDANLPSGCTSTVELPETKRYFVFDTVEIQEVDLSCEGYNFMGWQIATAGVTRINADYLRMPSADVVLRATWTKFSIEKKMDGTVHEKVTATFGVGANVNVKMRKLSGQSGVTVSNLYSNTNSSITGIKRADSLSTDVDISNDAYILSANNSETPIFGWFNDGTIYYYTDADIIFLNEDSHDMFTRLAGLTDFSDLSDFDSSNVKNMYRMFYGTQSDNIDGLAAWDTSKVTNMSQMFFYASSIKNIDGAKNWDVSKVTDMSSMFAIASSLMNIDGAANWDTSKVTGMGSMFASASSLMNIDGAANWNVSNVTNMSYMFSGASSLVNIDGVADWDTSKVTTMGGMFDGTKITNIDALADWDTSKVTAMNRMFSGASSLVNIDGAADWDVSKVTYMDNMFYNARSLVNIDGAADWNTSKVTNMSYMFYNASSLVNIDGAADWDVSNVTNMSGMLSGASSLVNIDGTADWNVSNVTNMSGMLSGATSLVNIDGVADWDTSKVTNMSYMFNYATSLANIDTLADWDVSKVTNMSSMFGYATSLTNIGGAANWNVSNVTNMSRMFISASSLANIDGAANWNVSNVTDMSWMFASASSLVNIGGAANWNVSKVTNMSRMFISASSLANIDGAANWNVSNVTNMNDMFNGASSLANIDGAANWNVSNVTNMSSMFASAYSLANIDGAANWNTSKVTNMSSMFSRASSLVNIDGAANWNVSNVTNMSSMFAMFASASSLVNIDGAANWNTSKVTNMSYMFYYAMSLAKIDGAANWNTSKVTNMSGMFYFNISITDLSPLAGWNTANLENKAYMFDNIPNSVARPSWY